MVGRGEKLKREKGTLDSGDGNEGGNLIGLSIVRTGT